MRSDRRAHRTWVAWALTGLLAYGVFLVALLPAGLVWDQAGQRGLLPDGLSARAVTGTLWSGSAARLRLPGAVTAERVTWRFRPGALLGGRMGWTVSADLADGHLQGSMAAGIGGIRVTDTRADLSAAAAVSPHMVLPVVIEGRLLLDLRQLVFDRDGRVREAEGVLGWLEAGAGIPEPVALGDLRADLQATGEGGLRLLIGDQGGPLVARGRVDVMPGGQYRIEGEAGSREGADPRLVQALRMLGTPDPDGTVPVGLSGSL